MQKTNVQNVYLEAFNQQHVTLVDVGRDGIQNFSPAEPIVNNTEYPLDVLIWSTGYESPGAGSYADKCAMNVVGRNGLTMSEKFQRGFTTLHGVTSRDLPNLFFIGSTQAGVSPNFLFSSDVMSDHIAYIIREAAKRATSTGKVVVEAEAEAEEAYAQKIASMAMVVAPIAECTPSYYNLDGGISNMPIEKRIATARFTIWGQGILDYDAFLRAWRENGDMKGLNVTVHNT